MFCTNCGSKSEEKEKFCGACGAKLKGAGNSQKSVAAVNDSTEIAATDVAGTPKINRTVIYVIGGIALVLIALFALAGNGGSSKTGLSIEPIRCQGTNLGNSVTYVSSTLAEPVEVFVKVGYFLEGALVGEDEEWVTVAPGGKSQVITGDNIQGILFSECKVIDYGKYTGGGE